MNRSRHVCHLTSVHPRSDTRIFHKECRSLARAGYSVSLVVADGLGDEWRNGVTVIDAGGSSGRIDRMTRAVHRVFERAVLLNAAIYHLHDPELIPVGLKLKRRGKKVIFDSHEDVPRQFVEQPYLNRMLRWLISRGFAVYEKWACRRFDAIVTATPFICNKFASINPVTVDINNFPILGELETPIEWPKKCRSVCYVGCIGAIRGIREMVSAMAMTSSGVRLQLGGLFYEPGMENEVQAYAGWSRVDALGFLDRSSVREMLGHSMAGLVTLHPTTNYRDALPVKMFEYMSAGIPVIASDFPLWQRIIVGNDCGICVDPLNPKAIADAIDFVIGHPDRARRMGENGRHAVYDRFNWSIEENKLLNLYQVLSCR